MTIDTFSYTKTSEAEVIEIELLQIDDTLPYHGKAGDVLTVVDFDKEHYKFFGCLELLKKSNCREIRRIVTEANWEPVVLGIAE